MAKNRKYSAETKLEVVVAHAVLVGSRKPRFGSVKELCRAYRITRSHLREWNKILRERGPKLFEHQQARTLAKKAELERLADEQFWSESAS